MALRGTLQFALPALLCLFLLGLFAHYGLRAHAIGTAAEADYTRLHCADLSALRSEDSARALKPTCEGLDAERRRAISLAAVRLMYEDLINALLGAVMWAAETSAALIMLLVLLAAIWFVFQYITQLAPVRLMTALTNIAVGKLTTVLFGIEPVHERLVDKID